LITVKKFGFLVLTALLTACGPRGPLALFQKLSLHDQYAARLKSAGLDKSAMGNRWLNLADQVYSRPLDVELPFKETGYFAAEKVNAAALRFKALRGQKLRISITTRPANSFALYADLSQVKDDGSRRIVASADSGELISCEVKSNGSYVLRLQPELLSGGEYTVTITTRPSLNFPVAVSGHPRIESFWGDSRDNGGRRHEGIDIFTPKGTPALAAAKGTVIRVGTNKLGGLVVLMQPDNEDYSLYYAHLGKQLVHDGQQVMPGDTVGTIDNTGNAKTTPSHLHFGIYTSEGAVDPLPFVDRRTEEPPAIKLSLARLNDTMRNSRTGEPVVIAAASADRYQVTGITGRLLWLAANSLSPLAAGRTVLRLTEPLYDRPDTTAARKAMLKPGATVSVLAKYDAFELVRYGGVTGWLYRR